MGRQEHSTEEISPKRILACSRLLLRTYKKEAGGGEYHNHPFQKSCPTHPGGEGANNFKTVTVPTFAKAVSRKFHVRNRSLPFYKRGSVTTL